MLLLVFILLGGLLGGILGEILRILSPGGAIQNTTGDGIRLAATQGVTLNGMNINNNSGNGIVGVFLQDTSDGLATRNKVQGNYIGTDVNGTAAIPNGSDGVAFVPATANTIGTSTSPGT